MKKTLCLLLMLFAVATLVLSPNSFAQGTDPEQKIRLIYFLPNNRTAQSDIDTQLDTMIKEVKELYAVQMNNHGFGRKTFEFETDSDGNAVVHHVTGQYNDTYYHDDSWSRVWDELGTDYDTSENIYFVALDVSTELIGSTACGIGGRHGGGGRVLLPASGRCFVTHVAAHELAHAFGLFHDYRNNKVLIANPYATWADPVFSSFCVAEWLDVHPYFNTGKTANSNTTISMSNPDSSPPNAIRLSFNVADTDGLHQAQLLGKVPSDFGLIGCKALDGTSTTVEFVVTQLVTDSSTDNVGLHVIDKQGNMTYRTFSVDVSSLLPTPTIVSMPDTNLAAAVRSTLGLAAADSLTQIKMLNLTSLRTSNRRITDLTGLEHAVNLRSLDLNANQIQNLTSLTGLTGLQQLYLSGNQISDITPLSGLTSLVFLYLSDNQISDITPLTGLTALDDLTLSTNQISNITPLTGLIGLQELSLRSNQITDVAPLIGLTQLTTLQLHYNPVENPEVLFRLKQGGTAITGVTIPNPVRFANTNLAEAVRVELNSLFGFNLQPGDPIGPYEMTQLTSLTASNLSIADLTGLETATGLTSLTLSNNAIVNLSPLSSLANLEVLDLSNNQITDVSLLGGLSSLTTLDLSGNTGITNPGTLYKLKQGGTTITGVDVPDAVVFTDDNLEAAVKRVLRIAAVDPILPDAILTLERFSVPGGGIVTLTGLESATALTFLSLTGNQIVNLAPLSGLTNLTTLYLGDNQIVNLSPLSSLSSLEILDLQNNQIEDVSALPSLSSLKGLFLRSNNVMDVTPLSTMTHLTRLLLHGNNNLSNLKQLVKLKEAGTSVDIRLPEPVTVPDANLAVALRTAIGLPTGDSIFPEDMESLTNLTASNRSIADLTGLEAATSLTSLTLSNNDIVNLTPLSALVSLTNLNLNDNEITDVAPLSGLTNLDTLSLRNNEITDVAPLAGLSLLTRLDLTGNAGIINPGALYKLDQGGTTIIGVDVPDAVVFTDTNLEDAVKKALKIAAVDPVLPDAMSTLTSLTASRKQITSLSGLEIAGVLERLDVGDNEITDVSPLRNLTRLETLDLADNQIEDVSVLSGLSNLETLDLRDNDIMDVIPLSTMTHLTHLYLRGNDNLSNLKQLVRLKEAGTRVDITLPKPVTFRDDNLAAALRTVLNLQTDDPIFPEDMQTLTTFSASNQNIENLTGLETATALTSLTLNNNEITSLTPLAKLVSSLEVLNLSNNAIRSLSSLSKLTSLTTLNLSNNMISSVSSLSKLVALETLNLAENQISSLTSLSALSSLTTLNLSNNTKIKDVLPLQALSSLTDLDLNGNTGLTEEKAAVLYKLQQGGTSITLPQGITLPTATEIVVFNNADLEAAVRSALRISSGYPVLKTKITELTRLTATRKEIAGLIGLEGATGLTRLDLGDNAIVDLGPLRNLTSLETLDLADNQIIALSPLSGLVALESLDLDDNQITDVSALSGLTSLKTLDLRDNDVMDVTPLKDLTNLTYIYLKSNENLENLEWLGALENLRSDIKLPDVVRLPDTNLDTAVRSALRTAGNTVSNELPMSEELLESLETLTASNSAIADLSGLEAATALTSLDLRNNQITDVSPLSKLYSLETLMLDGNPILDTSVLRELGRRGTTIDITIYRYPSWDVNQDGDVDEADVFLITATITGESPDVNGDGNVDADDETAADVNKDGNVDTDDILFAFEKFDRPVNLAAPLLSAKSAGLDWRLLERIDAGRLRVQLDILRAENDGSLKYQQAIAFLQAVLVALQPNQTQLLANYPNPFNPETWLPYQLARGSNVQITIYDMRGVVVRRLALGYRAEGYYRARGRAAHWEGRNEVGERVASGIYFYQLETDDTSLLRKMVILK